MSSASPTCSWRVKLPLRALGKFRGELLKVDHLRDAEPGAWVEREVCFPNSTVDRITPVTTDDDRAEVTQRFGVDDRWPVVCEPFTQWVLEDRSGLGRPPWRAPASRSSTTSSPTS